MISARSEVKWLTPSMSFRMLNVRFFFHRRSSVDLSKLNFPSFGLSLFALATVGGRDTKHLLTKKSRCYDINVIRQVAGYVDAPATLSYGSRTPLTCTTSLVRDFVSIRDKSKSSLADQKKLVRSVGQSGAAAARTKWKGRCWRPTAPGDKEPQQITINKRITISSWHVEVPLQL